MNTETAITADEFFATPAPTAESQLEEAKAAAAKATAELYALRSQIIAAATAKSGAFADEVGGMSVEEAIEILTK